VTELERVGMQLDETNEAFDDKPDSPLDMDNRLSTL